MINKLKQLIKEFEKKTPFPKYYYWEMTKNEQNLFIKHLIGSKLHIEFGAGGSTIKVIQKTNATIHSIESNENWIEKVKEYSIVRKALRNRLSFHHIDIGPSREWGYPLNDSKKENYYLYSSEIFNKIDPYNIDTILIDGRFRVACTLSSILNCYNKNHVSKKILIHDFWHRKHYHVVLNFLEVIDKADSLGVFKIKDNIDINELNSQFEKYKNIPR